MQVNDRHVGKSVYWSIYWSICTEDTLHRPPGYFQIPANYLKGERNFRRVLGEK
jgi:hypothetical protein